jgi:aromatase
MPQAQSSIVIHGNIDKMFAITNDIARWPELFNEYNKAVVLSYNRYDRFAKIVFQLTNEENETWQSWRILDFEEHTAIATRGEPKYPFLYMHLTWTYEQTEDGVRVTWLQDFEIDPKAPFTNEQAVKNMTKHMQENQLHFKEVLEALDEVRA